VSAVTSPHLSVDFDGNVVAYEAFELEALTLAYALTIHKSQGSEFPAVVVPMLNSHHIMLQRNLGAIPGRVSTKCSAHQIFDSC